MSRLNTFLKKRSARRSSTRRRPARFVSGFESLEPRLMLSVTAVLSPQGVLTVDGDQMDNNIVVSRDAAGIILVNDGATPIGVRGEIPTVTNTSLIEVLGRSGNDTIMLDDPNGTLPRANLSGDAGDDTLIGGLDDDTLDGGSGNDILRGNGGTDLLIGGAGDDQIFGGLGDDRIFGEAGNDAVNGGDGDDLVFLGGGDDIFEWNPGDDNDTVEGQAGFDTLRFNGANIGENIDISANGGRVSFFRNIANVNMDLNEVERIDFNALGGDDIITVNDLSGTDATEVNLNLEAAIGIPSGADTVIVNGTNSADTVQVTGSGTTTAVTGLAVVVNITGAEAAQDGLTVNALGGNDVVDASGLGADAIQLTADGGNGDDVLTGGDGNDTLRGGAGDDVLIGGPGVDILDGGPGNNTLIQD
jgi:Ca2+-binding RTX toxin-like protein